MLGLSERELHNLLNGTNYTEEGYAELKAHLIYDDILHVIEDLDLARFHFYENGDRLEEARTEWLEQHLKEHMWKAEQVKTPAEAKILDLLYKRDEYIIEEMYTLVLFSQTQSLEVGDRLKRLTLQRNKLVYGLLRAAINHYDDTLWGSKRNKAAYREKAKEVSHEIDTLEDNFTPHQFFKKPSVNN